MPEIAMGEADGYQCQFQMGAFSVGRNPCVYASPRTPGRVGQRLGEKTGVWTAADSRKTVLAV